MELITLEELKDVLKISRNTIYRLCDLKMPHFRVGNGYRFELDAVKAWLIENRESLAAITAGQDDKEKK